jgi:predicted NAD/FAD-binding protein
MPAPLPTKTARLYFRYRNLRLGRHSWSWLAPQDLLLGPRARGILRGLLRFHREAVPALQRRDWGPLDRRLREGPGLPAAFVDGLLLPAICTVCTCSTAQARGFRRR